jgi:hypothetical protein
MSLGLNASLSRKTSIKHSSVICSHVCLSWEPQLGGTETLPTTMWVWHCRDLLGPWLMRCQDDILTRVLSRGPATLHLDSWPVILWDRERVVLGVGKFLVIFMLTQLWTVTTFFCVVFFLILFYHFYMYLHVYHYWDHLPPSTTIFDSDSRTRAASAHWMFPSWRPYNVIPLTKRTWNTKGTK